MQETSFGVGDWARERTQELVEQYRSEDTRPLAAMTLAELQRLDDTAKDVLMLLRAHLTHCVRQAVPGHPQAMFDAPDVIDLRDVRIEIDQVISEVNDARSQIRRVLQDVANRPIVAATPETLQRPLVAEDRILELERQRRDGRLTESEFATALRAVLLAAKP